MSTKILEKHIPLQDYQIVGPKTVFQKLFLKALEKMDQGCLYIFLSNKEIFKIGKENDKEPAKIFVHNQDFFKHCIFYGEIGFAESYIKGYFSTENLYRLLEWFVDNAENSPDLNSSKSKKLFVNLLGFYNRILHLTRPNSIKMAKKNISDHYDLSNEFYELILDKTMTYSSAIFKEYNQELERAQIEKYEKIARKLNLRPGLKVLEIGSGWGGFARYIVENYGCEVLTITLSENQYKYICDFVKKENINNLKVELLDFRKLKPEIYGKFDRIVSIEMAEALGIKYFDIYFKTISNMLKDDGLVLIQYINYPESYYEKYLKSTDFIQKHIFPGGQLLSHLEVLKSLHRTSDLCLYDLESFGLSYAETLKKWKENFIKNIYKIKKLKFEHLFLRKWYYYLNYCEVGFRRRYINVCQILLSRPRNNNLVERYVF